MPNDLPVGIARWIEDFRTACRGYRIPEACMSGLERYAVHGQPVGDFLNAVLSNDFLNAVGRADAENKTLLREYALILYNDMPGGSYGSPQKVAAWESTGGLVGRSVAAVRS